MITLVVMVWAGAVIGLVTSAGLIVLAVRDARSERVPVRWGQAVTAVALGGLAVAGVLGREWGALAGAGAGAALVTGIQLVPYGIQARSGREAIGRADVRLGVPFGATLGWFGLGFTVVGFALALVAGLGASAALRRRRVPFVPFLAGGHAAALIWALWRL
ncbi:MAG: prepilin peptidase [Acidimicrobiales bacterium]